MFKKVLIVLSTVIFGNLSIAGSNASWTQEEIEYFQEKEYVGNRVQYQPFSLHYYPLYLMDEQTKDEYGIIGEDGLREIIKSGKRSKSELSRYFMLLRNEIYARKGYIFKGSDLREFFGKMDWYEPKVSEVELNKQEKKNVELIKELEEMVKSTKVLKDLYTREVVLKAKWGKGPGEFALEPLVESGEYSTSFILDVNGNFYILDPNNQRINVFTKEGNFTKSIPIPEELIYTYRDEKTSLVEGVGVDHNGNVYLSSSSTKELLTSGRSGEVVLKVNGKGEVLDRIVFKGSYVHPPIFYEADEKMYLWGPWGGTKAAILLDFENMGEVIELTLGKLHHNSFEYHGKSINFGTRRININYNKAPVVFNQSSNSRIVFYDGENFVFQDSDGEIKTKIKNRNLRSPRTLWFSYKEYRAVSISAWPYIDSALNIYFPNGTSTHLQVVKYTPTEEIWK